MHPNWGQFSSDGSNENQKAAIGNLRVKWVPLKTKEQFGDFVRVQISAGKYCHLMFYYDPNFFKVDKTNVILPDLSEFMGND